MPYKDKKGKWVGSVYDERIETSDNRKRKYNFKSKKEASEWETQTINKLDMQEKENKTNILLANIFDEFLENKKGVVRESTYKNNRIIIDNHLMPYFKKESLQNLNHNKIIKFRNHLLKNDLSNLRINMIIKMLKEIINYANNVYDLNISVFNQIKPLETNKKKSIDYYTLDEYKALESVIIDDIVYLAFFRLLYYSGLRKGEALALNWNDINFDENMLNVDKSINQKLKDYDYLITEPKNKSSIRNIKLDKKTIEILKELKNHYKGFKSFNNNFFIFGGVKPLPETTIQQKYNKYIKLANLKKIRIHDFRHSHASLLINSGATVLLVSKRLGHSKVDMTLNTYSHFFENKEQELIEILENE